MRRILIPCVCVLFFAAGFFCGHFWRTPTQDIDQESASEVHIRLLNLLKSNNLCDLPPEFNFWCEESVVRTDMVENRAGTYSLYTVTYPVGAKGDRDYSFVFNEAGTCLVASRDDFLPSTGLFADITGDGYMEKIFIFSSEPAKRHLGSRLQVFTFRPKEAILLLDVEYTDWLSPDDYRSVRKVGQGPAAPMQIQLASGDPSKTISFAWSKRTKRFQIEGAPSQDWKVVKNGIAAE